MTLKVAEQAWVEDVGGVETSKGGVVVETYRGMGADALHGGWVAEARVREKDNPHKQAMGDFRVNTFGDLVRLIGERWADRGVQMAGGTDHGIDADLSLVGFQETGSET